MLNVDESFKLDDFIKDFNQNSKEPIIEPSGDDLAAAFKIDEELVMIGCVSAPIPKGDLEGTAKYAYNWPTAIKDLENHKGHILVSIAQGSNNYIKRFKIFTKVICSILRTTDSIGVYKGTQSLLIPKEDYLNEAGLMNEDYIPLNLWVYFGLRTIGDKRAGYTYGLKEFNKTEMEIINSDQGLVEIRKFLFNTTQYVLEYDVEFKDGQTCGMAAEEKIKISLSKGKFVSGDSFKLAY